MSERTLLKKVKDLKALESQKKAIEKQMEALQEDIKKELQARGQEETAVGDWMVRFKAVISNKFETKAFAADHPMVTIWDGLPIMENAIHFMIKI